MKGELLDRAGVQTEFRSAKDVYERISGGAGPGGVKAVAPVGDEPITITIPAGVDQVSLLGEVLDAFTPAGRESASAGRPVAIVSKVMIEYRPRPATGRGRSDASSPRLPLSRCHRCPRRLGGLRPSAGRRHDDTTTTTLESLRRIATVGGAALRAVEGRTADTWPILHCEEPGPSAVARCRRETSWSSYRRVVPARSAGAKRTVTSGCPPKRLSRSHRRDRSQAPATSAASAPAA